jgi:hypothetical protein
VDVCYIGLVHFWGCWDLYMLLVCWICIWILRMSRFYVVWCMIGLRHAAGEDIHYLKFLNELDLLYL